MKNPTPRHIKNMAKGMIKKKKLSEEHCKNCWAKLYIDKFDIYEWCESCGYSNVKEIQDFLKGRKE